MANLVTRVGVHRSRVRPHAQAWDNDDWPRITEHAYLQRWGDADGAPEYAELELALAEHTQIKVPTLVLHGLEDADNLPATTENQSEYFTGPYERRALPGVGHFIPREAPGTTAAAIASFAEAKVSHL